jgi:glycerophosphoryl diester phosphodiesterase
VDVVELDVRWSADGALVVTHDPTELTLSEIRRLRPEMPTFDEVLEALRGRVALEVEIKNVPGESSYELAGSGIAHEVLDALRRHVFTNAFVASFDAKTLRSVNELDRNRPTGLLVEPPTDLESALELSAGRDAYLLPDVTLLERAGSAFVDRAHELGMQICAWTVDDPTAMNRVFQLGVDAVETNDPAMGVSVRNACAQD